MSPTRSLAQELFIDQFCTHADKIYRLAFALTLSEETARQLLYESFREAAEQMPSLGGTQKDPLSELIKIAWEKLPTISPLPCESNLLIDFLAGLNHEERLTLIVVDVFGFTRMGVMDLLSWPAETVDRYLAAGRYALLQHEFGKMETAMASAGKGERGLYVS